MSDHSLIKIDAKPLEKLIEVISNGIGTLYRPRAIRKEADAEAYKIEIVERAKSKALAEGRDIEADTYERIQERLLYKELKRQKNIDNVSQIAAEQLKIEETVSNDPVNSDWATRFFNIVEDVSDAEMQNLWGRILAGEVRQPKSFSVRTLELLKNLSKEEAETFTKFAQIALTSGDKYFVFDPDNGIFLDNNFGIIFSDKLLLVDVGLIVAENDLELSFSPVKDEEQLIVVYYGTKGFLISRKKDVPKQPIPVIVFSKPGIELLKLVQPAYNDKYIERIANSFKHDNTNIIFGDIVRLGNNEIKMFNEKQF